MKKFLSLIPLLVLAVLLSAASCRTGQVQNTVFASLSAAEAVASAANSAYLDSVVSGKTPTNDVPRIESAFNDTQLALHAAAVLSSSGMKGIVPENVSAQVISFTNLVSSVKH